MRRYGFLLIMIGLCLPVLAKQDPNKTMPLTTSSPKARELYKQAVTDFENFYMERANVGWRAAIAADPNFALAHACIAFYSRNPEEADAARAKAKALEPQVSPGERLMIEWIINSQENNSLAGIAAMNDMVAMFPKDKHLLYMVGYWNLMQGNSDPAQKMLERTLTIDKNFPAALNELSYTYARQREFDKALATLDRYVALLPNQPTPQHSYGEILMMAGHFEQAIEHFRLALKIDPQFAFSQLGLADSYALMGDQTRAREEYDKAISGASNSSSRLSFNSQKAVTWVRENNFSEANKAFIAVAEAAQAQKFDFVAANVYRTMALYQPDDADALKYLQLAEDALSDVHITQSDRERQRSRILRVRAVRAAHANQQELAQKTLQQLETMASSNRSPIVQGSYHGAAGALLAAQQKFSEAIPHLEEDKGNPFSLELLSQAYAATGAADKMHDVEVILRGMNVNSMEQALVVPKVRARQPKGL